MRPRPLGNNAKELRDLALMEASQGLRSIKEAVRDKRESDPFITLTEVTLHLHEIIVLLKRMGTEEEQQ